MPISLTPVIPRNITRAKRIAKQLHGFYPRQQLSACQATTSHVFGFKDWHALEEACKSADRKVCGPFDEELDEADLVDRLTNQFLIICKELGGVDPEADHRAPERGERDERLEKAGARWSVLFARTVLLEVFPTARDAPESDEYIDFLTEHDADELERLPGLLGQWWAVNVPHQPEVGAALIAFKLNPHKKTSLLLFGFYWGSLCMYYAQTISWTMAMGVAYMLAERFGSITIQQKGTYVDLMLSDDPPSQEMVSAALPTFAGEAADAQCDFFNCYPRDDFYNAYSKQPQVFMDSAKETMKILNTPGTKRGTWADR